MQSKEHDSERIRRILIVGGGTAGWMAAAYLNRRTDCAITLVESASVGTIGVGEATIPSMVAFVRNMGLDENEFMRRARATYKLGIRFDEWAGKDRSYWHPFGISAVIDGVDLFQFWLKALSEGRTDEPYSSYFAQTVLAEAGKAPRPFDESSIIVDRGAYAFHLDAAELARYLREIATAAGVEHLEDDVSDVALDERGSIERIDTESGRELTADLYVDCTGFRALLAEKALEDPWIDWSDLLLCDRALTVRLPPDATMHPFTRSTALDAGWVWRIPLSHRTGCGYVYSSRHVDDDGAARELLAHAHGIPSEDPRRLELRVGRRNRFWIRNCVSVGLSAGFVEPLESTGLHLIDKALELLVDHFPDATFDETLISTYNARLAKLYDDIRDFIVLHYALNGRDDTPFWRDAKSVAVPESLRALIERYERTAIVETGRDMVFPDVSFFHILSGNGRLPRRHLARADFSDFDRINEVLRSIRTRNAALEGKFPTHRNLMERVHATRDET